MGGGLAKYAPDALLSKDEARSALGDDFDDVRWGELADGDGKIECRALAEEVEYEQQKEPEHAEPSPWADRELPPELLGLRDDMLDAPGGPNYMFDRDAFARELEAIDGAFSDDDEAGFGYVPDRSSMGAGAAFGATAAYYDPDAGEEELTDEERHELKLAEIAAESERLAERMADAEINGGVDREDLRDLFGIGEERGPARAVRGDERNRRHTVRRDERNRRGTFDERNRRVPRISRRDERNRRVPQ